MTPHHVVVAGDWHSNARWATGVVELLPQLLPDEEHRIILHAGDFGLWPGDARYLRDLDYALEDVNAWVYWVDGNHEWHSKLQSQSYYGNAAYPVLTSRRTWWYPRGYRWTWYDRVWMSLGGAVSVDKLNRKEGISWWPEEVISSEQADFIKGQGEADVVLSHDCPAGVPLNLPRPVPRNWLTVIPEAERHRELLRDIGEAVKPKYWMHGHYHLSHRSKVQMSWGELDVTGLDCDGALSGNFRVLDVETMEWMP